MKLTFFLERGCMNWVAFTGHRTQLGFALSRAEPPDSIPMESVG
jgi:hypothetical protein